MDTLHRRLYHVLLRLHPAAFRSNFARDMALDFENAVDTYGYRRLFIDAAASIIRQWAAEIVTAASNPVSEPRPSLLAGSYVMVRDAGFTPLQLGLGFIASSTQLLLCILALNTAPRHTVNLSNASAFFTTTPSSTSADPGTASLSAVESSAVSFQPSQGNPAFIGIHSPQIIQPKPELLLFHPAGPLPSYEVATIKPLDPDAASTMVRLPPGGSLSPLSIRRYIMNAFGAVYAAQVIGGPEWLNKSAYLVNGKVPDDLASTLPKMTRDERLDRIRMMQQSLLAGRFHLRAHFETRVLPVYALVPARGGIRIAPVAAPPEPKPGDPPVPAHSNRNLLPGTVISTPKSNGLQVLNAHAIKMPLLTRIIAGNISDRPIVDRTGFTGYFDITNLAWTQLTDVGATDTADAPSLVGALEEQLGLAVTPSMAPIEVLVIDDIERPTPN